MLSAFSTGFFLGLSLIIAIGSQNAFVLRQGIIKQHTFYVAIFCSVSDTILILIGVLGTTYFFNDIVQENSKIIFGLSAVWLFSYGILRVKSAFKNHYIILDSNSETTSALKTILILSIFTFANPHVYLDTMILIGTISHQFIDFDKVYFAVGACSASFIWFFSLAYSAKLLTPIMQKPLNWRILDLLIALIMFYIAFNLAKQGDWL